MHIKSYDWVDDDLRNTSNMENAPKVKQSVQEQDVNPDIRLAKVKVNSDLTAPCNSSILYPADGGNMHCFTALTACAVLDVLRPPYSDPDGRHCQYYYDFPYTKFSVDRVSIPHEEQEGYAWIQERKNPEIWLHTVAQKLRSSECTDLRAVISLTLDPVYLLIGCFPFSVVD